jgi:alpha-tubulin suppressor-like RCC1 family protein
VLSLAGCLDAPPAGNAPDDGGTLDASAPDGGELPLGIFGGGMTFCALIGDGLLWCWGLNDDGQLGDGSLVRRAVPAPVQTSAGFPLIGLLEGATSSEASCAIATDRTAVCWGDDSEGQLGNGDDGDTLFADSRVMQLVGVDAIATGGLHSCALVEGGIWCWGTDTLGQRGDGTPAGSAAHLPAQVVDETGSPLSEMSALATARDHSCAVLAGSGQVVCWGMNNHGQCGRLDEDVQPCEVAAAKVVLVDVGLPLEGASAVATGLRHSCAVVGQNVYCWGHPRCGQLGGGGSTLCGSATTTCDDEPFSPPILVEWQGATCLPIRVVAGNAHTCAMCDEGEVFCWGDGSGGALGHDSLESSSVPVQVAGLSDVVGLAAASTTTCALTLGREVYCWGRGEQGQLGDGAVGAGHQSKVPTLVTFPDRE